MWPHRMPIGGYIHTLSVRRRDKNMSQESDQFLVDLPSGRFRYVDKTLRENAINTHMELDNSRQRVLFIEYTLEHILCIASLPIVIPPGKGFPNGLDLSVPGVFTNRVPLR